MYLIPEPELYFYLTLDRLGTQLTMFLEVPYLEGIESHIRVAMPVFNHSNAQPSICAADAY